jgi:hypothetical protein
MYTEHTSLEAHGFRIVDATDTGPRSPFDDLIWVGYGGMEGRWLTADQVEELAGALFGAATVHRARHAAEVPA